ncbi:MAG: hypothetical protein ABR511_01555 [Acidimicrobiales bacterium]
MPGNPTMRRHPAARLLALVAMSAALLAACGSGGSPQAQPAPGQTVFQGGDFDQLPRYPRSTSLNQPTQTAGVVAQTFSVPNATAQQIVQYYADHLAGWTVTEAVHSTGTQAYRGAWTKGDRELLVSGSAAPTLSQGKPVVQYSLELGPVRPLP